MAAGGIGKAVNAVRNARNPQAMTSLSQMVEAESLNNAINEAQRTGRSILEVGDDSILQAAQKVRQQTPEARQILSQRMQEIAEAQPARTEGVINDALGSQGKNATIRQVAEAARKKAQPMYNELEAMGDLDPTYTAQSNAPTVTRYKGGDDIAVAKSIRRNMAKEDPNFQWRKDENGNFDYEHFVKDPTRAEYLRTLPSTYKNPDTIIQGTHNNEPREYLLKRYYNLENGQNVYDMNIKTNGALINKIAREGRKGQHEFEKVMRQTPQASGADLGLSQTGNAPSSTLRADNNISSLGALVKENQVLADVIARVKRANSSLKNLPDTDFRVINEARKALSQAILNRTDISGHEARKALNELDPMLDNIIPTYKEVKITLKFNVSKKYVDKRG